MEKILINNQTEKTRKDIINLEEMVENLNKKLVKKFNDLGISALTTDLLEDALFNQSEKIIKQIWDQAEPEIRSSKNIAIKTMFKNAVQTQVNDFLLASKIKVDPNLFRFITVTDGDVQLIEGYEETIKKSNFYYIENEQEKAIFDSLSKIAEGINEFRSSIGENAKSVFYRIDDFLKFLVLTQDRGFELDNENDYKFLSK